MKCNQCKWNLLHEEELIGWWGKRDGVILLFQCSECGALLKMKISNDRRD